MSVVLVSVGVACASSAAAIGSWVGFSTGRRLGQEVGFSDGRIAGRQELRLELDPPPIQLGVATVFPGDVPMATDVDSAGRICSIFTDQGGIDLSRLKPEARARLGRLLADSNTSSGASA